MSSDILNPSRVVSTNGALSSSGRRERHAVHEEIQPAELTVDALEHRGDLAVVCDVAREAAVDPEGRLRARGRSLRDARLGT